MEVASSSAKLSLLRRLGLSRARCRGRRFAPGVAAQPQGPKNRCCRRATGYTPRCARNRVASFGYCCTKAVLASTCDKHRRQLTVDFDGLVDPRRARQCLCRRAIKRFSRGGAGEGGREQTGFKARRRNSCHQVRKMYIIIAWPWSSEHRRRRGTDPSGGGGRSFRAQGVVCSACRHHGPGRLTSEGSSAFGKGHSAGPAIAPRAPKRRRLTARRIRARADSLMGRRHVPRPAHLEIPARVCRAALAVEGIERLADGADARAV